MDEGDTAIVTRLPACDFCKAYAAHIWKKYGAVVEIQPARFDAQTIQGSWANMCPDHFLEKGYGKLGTGFGQRLIEEGPK